MTLTLPAALLGERARATAARLGEGLFPHQIEGVAFLLERRRAILADDMGLGKTRQAVVALREAAPLGPWLVVCPASVKLSWVREIVAVDAAASVSVVGPAPPPAQGWRGWVVVNYELLARHAAALAAGDWAGYVLDEAHYLRNYRSRRSRAARALLARAAAEAPVYLLTGTPLTNRPRDLFPLLQLVGHPLGRDFLAFARRYCDARHNGFGWITDGASNLEEFTVQLHGTLLRREKHRVLSLPPKLVGWRDIALPSRTAARETRQVLAGLVRLARERAQPRAAARDPAATAAWRRRRLRLLGHVTTVRRLLALAKVRASTELIEAAVDQGDKVLVFSCFTEPLVRLQRHFGAQAVLLTGATPAAERQALVDRFQTDAGLRVFCANLLAGGVGLTLTAARQVVFNDLDWVPAHHQQAEDRACRIGQRASVVVHYLVARGTLDALIVETLETKRRLIKAVVEGEAFEGSADPDPAPGAPGLLEELEATLRRVAPGVMDLPDEALERLELGGLLPESTPATPPPRRRPQKPVD